MALGPVLGSFASIEGDLGINWTLAPKGISFQVNGIPCRLNYAELPEESVWTLLIKEK